MNIKEIKNMLKHVGYEISDNMSPISKEIIIAHMKAVEIEVRQAVIIEAYKYSRKSMEEIISDIFTNNSNTNYGQFEEWISYWAKQKQKTNEEWENEWKGVTLEVEQEFEERKDSPEFLKSIELEQKVFREDGKSRSNK